MRLRLLLVAGLTVLLASCGTPTAGVPHQAPATSVVAVAPAPDVPVEVSIPQLGVTDDVVQVALAADGSMELPDITHTGWYRLGPRPGAVGAAVLVSHVNWAGASGAFTRLSQLRTGAELSVTDAAGVKRGFVVFDVETLPKAQYAAKTVPLAFGARTTADVVLVTCGGGLHGHEYDSNVVVSAHLKS